MNGDAKQVVNDGKAEKPKEWFEIVTAFIGGLPAFAAGITFGWMSPSIPYLISEENDYNFTLEQCSFFAVIAALTAVVVSVVPAYLVDKIGRKNALLLVAVPQFLTLVFVVVSKQLYMFYISRFICGFGDAGLFALVPIYFGEVLTPKVRGRWGNLINLYISLGQLTVNAIGGYLDVVTTAYILMTIPIVFTILFLFMPESPYYLVMKGRLKDAKVCLRRLRRTQNVEEELQQIEAAVKRQTEESKTWKDLFALASNRKAVVAIVFMRAAQQMSGFGAFGVYTKYIFQEAGGNVSATESAIIFTGVQFIAGIPSILLVDKLGRRLGLMISLFGMFLVVGGQAIFAYLDEYLPSVDVSGVKFLPLVFMLVYILLWSTGLGPIPNIMLSELFPAGVKGKGLCIANIAFGLCYCLGSKIFQFLVENFGFFSPFALFSLCSFVSSFLTFFIVPETKEKTLEEIQLSLKGKSLKK